jgi:hypothetical protein
VALVCDISSWTFSSQLCSLSRLDQGVPASELNTLLLMFACSRNGYLSSSAPLLISLFSSYLEPDTSLLAAYPVLTMLYSLDVFPAEARKGSRLIDVTLLCSHTVQLLQKIETPCPHFVLMPSISCACLCLTAYRALVLGFLACFILCDCMSAFLRELMGVLRSCAFPAYSSDSCASTVATCNDNIDLTSQMTLTYGCGVRAGLL